MVPRHVISFLHIVATASNIAKTTWIRSKLQESVRVRVAKEGCAAGVAGPVSLCSPMHTVGQLGAIWSTDQALQLGLPAGYVAGLEYVKILRLQGCH